MRKRAGKFQLYASARGTRKSYPTQNGKVGNGWGNTTRRTITGPVLPPVSPPPLYPFTGKGGETLVGWSCFGVETADIPPCSGGVEVGGD
ncbi:hypothetical protein ABIE78_001235 [Sinorhizobium fredii]